MNGVRRWSLLLVACAGMTGIASAGLAQTAEPICRSDTQLTFRPGGISSGSPRDTAQPCCPPEISLKGEEQVAVADGAAIVWHSPVPRDVLEECLASKTISCFLGPEKPAPDKLECVWRGQDIVAPVSAETLEKHRRKPFAISFGQKLLGGIEVQLQSCAFELLDDAVLGATAQASALRAVPASCIRRLVPGGVTLVGAPQVVASIDERQRLVMKDVGGELPRFSTLRRGDTDIGSLSLRTVPGPVVTGVSVHYPDGLDRLHAADGAKDAALLASDERSPSEKPNTIHLSVPVLGDNTWKLEPPSSDVSVEESATARSGRLSFRLRVVARTSALSIALKHGDVALPQGYVETRIALGDAKRQSLPLPVRRPLFVECRRAASRERDFARAGDVIAIDNDAIDGQCTLSLDLSALDESVRRNLHFFGAQVFVIEVTRGEKKTVHTHVFEPPLTDIDSCGLFGSRSLPSADCRPEIATLDIPSAGDDAEIRIKVTLGADAGSVVYRPRPPAAKDGDGKEVKHDGTSDDVFTARIRPRGRYGWSSVPIRTYVAATYQAAFRFPASPHDMKSDSDPRGYQFVAPRVGALFAVEPWNYARGENPYPLGPRFVIGGNMISVADPSAGGSFVTGLGTTLPFYQTDGHLRAAFSMNVLYEADRFDFVHGNRFLIAASAELGDLFSGTSTKPKN